MKRFCTDIAQCQRLIAQGLDPKTADLYITPKIGGYVISTEQSANSKPAWSLSALVDLLPVLAEETVSEKRDEAGFVQVCKRLHVAGEEAVEKNWPTYWPQMFFGMGKNGYGYGNVKNVLMWNDGPVIMGCYEVTERDCCWVNSAVDLICWCLDNGLIEKKGR